MKSLLPILILSLNLSASFASLQAGGPEPKKWALLVGINKYRYMPDLKGCVNDVTNMQKLLVDKFGFSLAGITALLDERATREAILKELENLTKAGPNDIVVFHFSGHGSQMPDRNGDEPDGLDETLVPHDSRDPQSRILDISDDEINALLQRILSKNITFFFDSCHSGAGTKGNPRRVAADKRKLPAHDDTRVPPDRTSGILGKDVNYLMISSCRSGELSNEYRVGNQDHGALTWFLTRNLWQQRPGVTWRDVIDDVMVNVNRAFLGQTPQLHGRGDRLVFDTDEFPTRPHILVMPDGPGRVILEAGRVQGLTVGSLFEIYPPGHRTLTGGGESKLVLEKVEDFWSEGLLLEGKDPKPASRAREQAHRYQDLILWVAYENQASSPLLTALEKRLQKYATIQVAQEGLKPHLVIKHKDNHLLLNAAGHPMGNPFAVGGPNAVAEAADWLLSWAKWFNVLSIERPSNSLPISLTITQTKKRGSKSAFDYMLPGEALFEVGDLVRFQITNHGREKIHIVVLVLSSSGAISEIYPAGLGVEPLAAGREWALTQEAYLEEGMARETSIIKVFAALEPLNMGYLHQQPFTRDTVPRPVGLHPLEQLLGHGARGMLLSEKAVPMAPWGTVQKTVEIRKRN